MAGAAIFLLVIGILAVISFAKGNYNAVASQLNSDLFGSGSTSGFLIWVGAILFVAVMGSVLQIPRAAKMFVILILVVYVLNQQGLWTSFENAISSASAPQPAAANTSGVGQAETALGTAVSSGGAPSTASGGGQATGPAAAPSWVPSGLKFLWGGS